MQDFIRTNGKIEGKGKDKVVPVFNQEPRNEDVWRSGCVAPSFLTSATDGGE
jgi:hypothetical protein